MTVDVEKSTNEMSEVELLKDLGGSFDSDVKTPIDQKLSKLFHKYAERKSNLTQKDLQDYDVISVTKKGENAFDAWVMKKGVEKSIYTREELKKSYDDTKKTIDKLSNELLDVNNKIDRTGKWNRIFNPDNANDELIQARINDYNRKNDANAHDAYKEGDE